MCIKAKILTAKDLAIMFNIPETYIQQQLQIYGKQHIMMSNEEISEFASFAGLLLPNDVAFDDVNIAQILKEKDKHRNKLNSKELHYRFSKDFNKTRRVISKQLTSKIIQNQY